MKKLILITTLLAFTTPLAATARAATYDVYTCRGPAGQPMGADGWSVVQQGGIARADLSCTAGGLNVTTPSNAPANTRIGLELDAPSDLTLPLFSARFALVFATGVSQGNWHIATELRDSATHAWQPFSCPVLSACGDDPANPFSAHPPASAVRWSVVCVANSPGGGCSAPDSASIYLGNIRFVLDDSYPPTLSTTPTGSLLADGPVANFRDIAFQATDRGSGVQRAVLEVDGRAVVDQLVDPNGGACVPPYDHVVPCKLAVAGTVGFDTTTVADGPHTGRLLIYDATGGNSTAFGPFHFVTSNRTVGAVCATGAKPPLRFSFKPGVVSFGRQGLLTAQLNQSVGPVEVAVLEGATALRKLATLKPDGQGRLFYRLGAGASRSIRLGLRPAGASSQRYACSTPKTLAVRAGVTLSLSDRRLRNGDRLQLGGRVLGGAAAAQKDVVVQARALHGRSWSTVRVVRADNRGRYRLRYRFRRTFWPVTYQFRAEVRPDRTFPYALGHSRIRAVKVVP